VSRFALTVVLGCKERSSRQALVQKIFEEVHTVGCVIMHMTTQLMAV